MSEHVTLRAAVDEAVEAGKLAPTEAGAVALARLYADQIDAGEPLDALGPKLLATLVALGLPGVRAAGKGADESKIVDPLAGLRAQRRRAG